MTLILERGFLSVTFNKMLLMELVQIKNIVMMKLVCCEVSMTGQELKPLTGESQLTVGAQGCPHMATVLTGRMMTSCPMCLIIVLTVSYMHSVSHCKSQSFLH